MQDPPPPLRLRARPRRGPAVLLSVLAVALFNVGVALLIVALLGRAAPLPVWASAALLALALVTASVAIQQWRQYVASSRPAQAPTSTPPSPPFS